MSRLIDLYVRLLEQDLEIFGEKWMYIPFLVPITFFIVFFLIKWALLTAPIWIPLKIAFSGLGFPTQWTITRNQKEEKEETKGEVKK